MASLRAERVSEVWTCPAPAIRALMEDDLAFGQRIAETKQIVNVPVGAHEAMGNVTFALLDGEHDVGTILNELAALWPAWMHPKGRVVVDNTDKDPLTWPSLKKHWRLAPIISPEWAVVLGIK